MKKLQLLLFIVIGLTLFSCGNDDEGEDENEDVLAFTSCCGENPYDSINVNTIGANIIVSGIFTPNGDSFNDGITIRGFEDYPINNIKIFDEENNLVNDISNESSYFLFPNSDVLDDVYRYKIVINNESEFLRQGYVCAITETTTVMQNDDPEIEGCLPSGGDNFDPLISFN